jgi:hypothetical protein
MNPEPAIDDVLRNVSQTLATDRDVEQSQAPIPKTWRELQDQLKAKQLRPNTFVSPHRRYSKNQPTSKGVKP